MKIQHACVRKILQRARLANMSSVNANGLVMVIKLSGEGSFQYTPVRVCVER
jgi:hypothetical protein